MSLERKIDWCSCYYDEIELVYEKANENETIASILSELETMALQEAEKYCESSHEISDRDKETIIYRLSEIGLQEFDTSIETGKITVTFSPYIQSVLGSTMFLLLNQLEKLDGSFNLFCPKCVLEMKIPIGASKGLVKCSMIIHLLYPWISVMKTSSDYLSETLDVKPKKKSNRGFFAKLFGKK